MYQWKNFGNRSVFFKVTVKDKVGRFFETQCTLVICREAVRVTWSITPHETRNVCICLLFLALGLYDVVMASPALLHAGKNIKSKTTLQTTITAAHAHLIWWNLIDRRQNRTGVFHRPIYLAAITLGTPPILVSSVSLSLIYVSVYVLSILSVPSVSTQHTRAANKQP